MTLLHAPFDANVENAADADQGQKACVLQKKSTHANLAGPSLYHHDNQQ